MKKEILYNCEFTNYDYLKEDESKKIKLEYYSVLNEDKELYGIEIVKKEKSNFGIEKIEKDMILDYTNNKEKMYDIIKSMYENRVTPVALKDIIRDINEYKV